MGPVGLGCPLWGYYCATNGRRVWRAGDVSGKTRQNLLARSQMASRHQAKAHMQCVLPLGRGHDLLGQDPARKQSSVQSSSEGWNSVRTAHFTPTIQLPLTISPFLRTAHIASTGFLKPILKQLVISTFGSGSVVSPSCLKYSTATLYLSGG